MSVDFLICYRYKDNQTLSDILLSRVITGSAVDYGWWVLLVCQLTSGILARAEGLQSTYTKPSIIFFMKCKSTIKL